MNKRLEESDIQPLNNFQLKGDLMRIGLIRSEFIKQNGVHVRDDLVRLFYTQTRWIHLPVSTP